MRVAKRLSYIEDARCLKVKQDIPQWENGHWRNQYRLCVATYWNVRHQKGVGFIPVHPDFRVYLRSNITFIHIITSASNCSIMSIDPPL